MSPRKSTKHLKLYPNLHVVLMCLFFLQRRSIDCIQYLKSGPPISLRTSNIHSALKLTLKRFTLSLKVHKAPWDRLVLEGVLILTAGPAQVYLGHAFQTTGFSCKEQRQSLSFHAVGKKTGWGAEWSGCATEMGIGALGVSLGCFYFLVWCSFHYNLLCKMP